MTCRCLALGTQHLSANKAALVYPTPTSSSALYNLVQDDLVPLVTGGNTRQLSPQ